MKLETIKHQAHTVSCVSESMADNFRDNITEAQYEVLKHNVYTLEEGDAIREMYHGCGCGWVEFDTFGNATDLKYINEDFLDLTDYEDDKISIPGHKKDFIYKHGQEEQNITMMEFHTYDLVPKILLNGSIRIFVNFSCYQLVRF